MLTPSFSVTPTQWEYKVLKLGTHSMLDGVIDESVIEEGLNVLGSDGWELVDTIQMRIGKDDTTIQFMVLLKRPKSKS